MILTLTASIMYWSLQRGVESSEPSESEALAEDFASQFAPSDGEGSVVADGVSNLAIEDTATSDTSQAGKESYGDEEETQTS